MAFFLPVIRPPDAMISNPLTHYGGLASLGVTVAASSGAPGDPLKILIRKPGVLHPAPHNDPVSTVFAMTSGFVSNRLPGQLTLRVWTGDFQGLTKADGSPRADRIVLGSMNQASIGDAIATQIVLLSDGVLQEAWSQNNGGSAPVRSALEDSFKQRFLAGDCEIFVEAGTALGTGLLDIDATGAEVAKVTLRASFAAAGADPGDAVSPEDLIDTALRPSHLLKFGGHPLLTAISGPISIHFLSRFLIWDNTPHVFGYIPLQNTDVTLYVGPDLSSLPSTGISLEVPWFTATTDSNGTIDVLASDVVGAAAPRIPSRALIHFRYATSSKTFGARQYQADVKTNAHKARLHVDVAGENTKDYRAKYEVLPGYKSFVDDIVSHEADEKYNLDRGFVGPEDLNVDPLVPLSFEDLALLAGPVVVPALSTRDFMKQIARFEATYKADVVPAPSDTFNILVEGDSWLHYPFAYNDIYGHLDQIFWAKKKPGVVYNRIPLQHYGDRSEQMFSASSATDRQWTHTREFLSEYKIDLIIVSAGGNDMAEPGIAAPSDLLPYWYFINGCFDPFLAASGSSMPPLSPAVMATAQRLMSQSFAVLLKNHPWYSYINNSVQLDEASLTAVLAPLLGQVIAQDGAFDTGDLSQQGKRLDDIGHQVIANFPPNYPSVGPEADLIDAVFDSAAFAQRYIQTKANWQILLDEADQRDIPVISHTYGYPLFNEKATSALGSGQIKLAGPWFSNRFQEAQIVDRRIQKICLKVILDRFVTDILEPLKNQYQYFDYVDVRDLNSSTGVWRDEMHLHGSGYKKVAEKMFDKVMTSPKFADRRLFDFFEI